MPAAMTSRSIALSSLTIALLATGCVAETDSMDLPGDGSAIESGFVQR